MFRNKLGSKVDYQNLFYEDLPMLRITSPAIALTLALTAPSHANPYVGVGLGSDTVTYTQDARITQLGTFDAVDISHLSSTGVLGSLFAGYFSRHNSFYLAGEFNANLSSTEFKSSNAEFLSSSVARTQFKINNSFGISLVPGYQYSPTTLFYGRLGYTSGHLKIRTTDASLENISSYRNGFRYGLGIANDLSSKLSLRLDYSRIDYSKTHLNTLDGLSNTTKVTSIKPQQQLIELGLIYKFN